MNGPIRTGSVLAVLFALSMILWPGHGPAAGPPAVARGRATRIGVINLTHVLKGYDRFKLFEAEMKKLVEGFQLRIEEKKAAAARLAEELVAGGIDAASKADLEDRIRKLEREMEDIKTRGARELGSRQGRHMKTLYADVIASTKRYARKHGYDVILHYNDAVTDEERDGEQNIARKLQAGALMPMFTGEGVEISREIIADLNRVFKHSSI